MPKASIIIPAYNAASFIDRTLESIVGQSFKDYECIVIDDGSTDDTASRVRALGDSRFRVITIENSGGPAIPRNIGLSAAEGEYVFIFDSDDIMLPQKVEKCISALDKHRKAAWLFTNFQTIDEEDTLLNNNFLQEYSTLWDICGSSEGGLYSLDRDKTFNGIIKVNFIGTSSVVLRKSSLSDGHRFDESLKNSDDRLFWAQLAASHDAIFINEILHQYRIRANALSKKGFDRRAPSKISGLKKIRDLCKTQEQKKVVNKQIYRNYLVLCNHLRREGRKGAFRALISSLNYGFDKSFLKSLLALSIRYR